MNTKRFSLSRIFWVLLGVYIFFALLGFIVLAITPVTTTNITWEKIANKNYFISQTSSLIFSTFFYYFTLNIFYNLIAARKSFVHFVKPIVISFIAMAAYQALSNYFLKDYKVVVGVNNNESEKLPLALMIFVFIFTSIFFNGVSMLIAYLTFLRDEKKQRKVLEEQKMQLEVEKSQANLNFLKAQINPHFLHNTLNFLYAKALPLSADLSEGILTLSDMMRYALSEGSTEDGKAPLKDEIEHVRNVIKIQQLRFSNTLKVEFEVEGVVNGKRIIPFVLITIVENAFKHGDLKDPNHPICIKLKVEQNSLFFFCRNRKKSGPKEISTGIGLDNIKKRLDLAYGKNYSFNVKDDAQFYTSELIIERL